MRPFSIFESELGVRTTIEASAGTGKTHTVSGLFFRLILEKGVGPEKILIVTFTILATKELKDRIYNYLTEAILSIEEDRPATDELVRQILDIYGRGEEVHRTLKRTLRSMDEVTIRTIHSFCQQMLQEESLMTGTPPELEIMEEDEWMQEAVEDFWRLRMDRADKSEEERFLIEQILQKIDSPDTLLRAISTLIYDPDLPVTSDSTGDPLEESARLLELRREMSGLWKADREEIEREYRESDVSRASQYADSRFRKVDSFLNEPIPVTAAPDSLEHFVPEIMQKKLKKNGRKLPGHRFYDLCGEYQRLVTSLPGWISGFLEEAITDVRERRREKRAGSFGYSYRDLLAELDYALQESRSGPLLADRIRRRFPYALVDEFQDTDPAQYRIFRTLYPERSQGGEHALLMIGDPKQSIYAFRGADLYTYLQARGEVDPERRYTLNRNFRSRPRLVEAVNRLFDPPHETPFLESSIRYRPVESAREDLAGRYRVNGREPVPLSVTDVGVDGSKARVKSALFDQLVHQVTELIRLGRSGRVEIPDGERDHRPLNGGDIAILIQEHADGDEIRRRLSRRGIRTVSWSRESIFESPEADRLLRLMRALLDPGNPAVLTEGLVTGFFTDSLTGLEQIMDDPARLGSYREKLAGLRDLWYERGVESMMRQLLFAMNGMETLSGFEQGERTLVNLMQLTELASRQEVEYRLDPHALQRWLVHRINRAGTSDEEQMRLESDEELVRISTIHNSKGLQFPVVFCPTLCIGREASPDLVVTAHEPHPPFRKVVNMEQIPSSGKEQLQMRARREAVAEEIRKTYVAVTRAQFECRLFWGGTKDGHVSGLGALLRGREKLQEELNEKWSCSVDPAGLSSHVRDCFDEKKGILEWRGAEPADPDSETGRDLLPDVPEPVSGRLYRGPSRLSPEWNRYNFSSLAAVGGADEEMTPGRNDEIEIYLKPDKQPDEDPPEPEHLIQFPRGKEAGIFLHALFEHPDLDFRTADGYPEIVREVCGRHGVDSRWQTVLVRMLETVPEADYGSLELNRVAPASMVPEMEFSFPVRRPVAGELYRIIRGEEVEPENHPDRGFMNGFIDLVTVQNGRYYILDYKSNDLGDRMEDYAPDRLTTAMREAGYDLQYHIYTAALIRYLESLNPDFEYRRDFGGVCYLFLRGLRRGSRNGVFLHKPEWDVMKKFQEVLDEG